MIYKRILVQWYNICFFYTLLFEFKSQRSYMLFFNLILIILSIAFTSVKDCSIAYSRITQLLIIYILGFLYKTFFFLALKENIYLYNATIQLDIYNYVFIIFVLTLSFFILVLTSFYPVYSEIKSINLKILNKIGKHYKITEYSLLILFIISGSLSFMVNNDLITFFLAIELQSYGLYLLCTVFKDSECSTKAGLTYFLLGGLSSCIILLGLSLLYINFGITSLENFYLIFDISNLKDIFNIKDINILSKASFFCNFSLLFYCFYNNYYIDMALLVLSMGLLFKISGAPFHFWSPDVYDHVPTIVTTYVSIIGKLSILVLLLYFTFVFNQPNRVNVWITNMLTSSLLSMIIGTVLGLTQKRIKRLYAYSTISHIGFILLALSINTIESIQAFMFYIIQYSISNLNAFILLITIGYYMYNFNNNIEQYNKLKEKLNSPLQLISQLRGLFIFNPLLALSKTVTIFSFLGIPPLLGFFGKQMVLSASLDAGYIFMSFIAILTSVIGAVYYLIVIKQIYFDKSEHIYNYTKSFSDIITLSTAFTLSISIATFLIVIFIFRGDIILNLLFLITTS